MTAMGALKIGDVLVVATDSAPNGDTLRSIIFPPRRNAIASCVPTPTFPRSDDNKDAVIRPGTLRFPYAQTAERAWISCLFLGDTRLGEGRTTSLF